MFPSYVADKYLNFVDLKNSQRFCSSLVRMCFPMFSQDVAAGEGALHTLMILLLF